MGRTLLPFRIALDVELASWKKFGALLSNSDQIILEKIFSFALEHGDAGSLAARPIMSEFIFISALIEQQNMIEKLENRIIYYEKVLKIKTIRETNEE